MPPIVAIVGRPNVGKSTLFNKLTRSRAALVDDQPGITRDRIYAGAVFEGRDLTLVDTGGLDSISEDPLLRQMSNQADTAINEAAAVILVTDAREGLLPADRDVAERLRIKNKNIFIAANKIDGPELEHLMWDFYSLGMEKVFPVSALHGYGITSLVEEIAKTLPDAEGIEPQERRISAAIIGKPNVGKSSLINRILEDERLIVSELPGTTRDSVDISIKSQGTEFIFIDTAGIRKKGRVKDKIEKFSVAKALESIGRCDIAVIVIDAEEGVSEQDARIASLAASDGKGVIVAVNKSDLIDGKKDQIKRLKDSLSFQLRFVSFAPSIFLSAMTGKGVRKIFYLLSSLYSEISTRISTASVNKAVEEIVSQHPPVHSGKGSLKISYATQAGIRPPTFVLFVNKPDLMTASYERYLINSLREQLKLPHSPIKIVAREKRK